MNYPEKVENLLKENMTERGFSLWSQINKRLPNIWENPTSSTGKYHKKLNGEIPNQAEHVYQMLFASVKMLKMFNYQKNTTDADKILMAVALHDSLKYGKLGTRTHTDYVHDKNAGDMICENKDVFTRHFSDTQVNEIEEMIRFHSGQWSTDVPKNKPFTFKDYNPLTMFVHCLDMFSTADLIQTDIRE